MRNIEVYASQLQVGDVVRYNPRCSWRVNSVAASGKSVRIHGTYERWDYDGDRVGEQMSHTFRAATLLSITR